MKAEFEEIFKKQMNQLRNYLGDYVVVEYVWAQAPHTRVGKFTTLDDYLSVHVSNMNIPFIGIDAAIRRIRSKEGNILYENPFIDYDYDGRGRNSEERFEMIDKCFGEGGSFLKF